MTSKPMEFRGPMGFRGPMKMTLTNQFVEHQRRIRKKLWYFPLRFWSSQSRTCPIFELTPGPRLALGRLRTINEYIYCFLWQIISYSLISLLIIAVRNLLRFSHCSFVTAYEPIIILKLD